MLRLLGKLAEKIGILVLGGQVNIENFYSQNGDQQTRPRNEQILLKQVRNEVYSRLNQSLHSHFITLDKESQPQQVSRPWDADIKVGLKDSEPLPIQTTILDVFNRDDIGGKLLILGQPGAGKTTTQLELAKLLLEHCVGTATEYPIPVLLNLSAWRKGSIHDWLVEELGSKYGVRNDIGANWLKTRSLLLLLDGLDELKSELQEPCVKALNLYLAGKQAPEYAVICCRTEEYGLLKTRLQLNGAIQLKSLTNSQIRDYLADIGQEALWSVVSNDIQLMELTRTPLMLSVTALAYQEVSLEEWQRSTSSFEDRKQILWDAYLRRMVLPSCGSRVYKTKQIPSQKQTRYWLIWLAKQLTKESQTEFLLERISAEWILTEYILSNNYQRNISFIYRLKYLISFIILIGSLIVFLLPISFGFYIHPFLALLLVHFVAIVIGFPTSYKMITISITKSLELKESFKFSDEFKLVSYVFLFFLIIFSAVILLATSDFSLVGVLVTTLSFPWMLLLIFYGIEGKDLVIRPYANYGVMNSLKSSLIFGVVIGIAVFIFIFSLLSSSTIQSFSLFVSLTCGLVACILSILGSGGLACLQHFFLRLCLFQSNVIPWNYARFLDYCTERVLIQRVGGRYRFIHKQLQEHFAVMPLERS